MSNSKDESRSTEHALPLVLSYLCGLVKNSSDAGLQDIAVMEYSSLLYGQPSRQLFWKQRSETVAPLIEILRKAGGIGGESSASLWSGNATVRSGGFEGLSGGVGLQLLYHVLLVLWQLSFEAEDIGDDLNEYVETSLCNAWRIMTNTDAVNMISFFYILSSYDFRQRRRPHDFYFRRYTTSSNLTHLRYFLRQF